MIDISRIRPDPNQPRQTVDPEKQQQLADSVSVHGIRQPITVRYIDADNIFQIISGERRYQASLKVGLSEMPCWIQSPQQEEILIHQVVENWQRADLHPFDLADTLAELRDKQNYSQKDLARLTGKPESEISKILSLLKIRPALQQQYRNDKAGGLSRRHLESIAKLPEEQQEAVHTAVQERGLTARETEEFVQKALPPKKGGSIRRGAPQSTIRRIVTPKGTVTVSLRRQHVTTSDIIDVLKTAQQQLEGEAKQAN